MSFSNALGQFNTVTYRWRVRWWKIPWYVLRRKEWNRVTVYHDVIVDSIQLSSHGDGMIINVDMRVPPTAEKVYVSASLKIPEEE